MTDPGLVPGLLMFLLFSWLGCLVLFLTQDKRETLRFQIHLFLCAFAVRFTLSIIIYQFGLVSVIGDEDGSSWVVGARYQETWLQNGIGLLELPGVLARAFDGQNHGYLYLLGALFYLTDSPYRLSAAALDGLFGALTVIFVYRSARCLFSPSVAYRAGWLTCFFPSMIIWSAQTLKEPVVIFLETAALYGCLRLQREHSVRHLALCAGAMVLILPFRFYAAFIVGAAVLLALLMRGLVQGRSRLAAVGLAVSIAPLVLGMWSIVRHQADTEHFDLNRVQKFRHDVSTRSVKWGGLSGVQTADVRTPGGLIFGTAVGAAHLLLAPFPWQLGGASLRMVLTLPELLIWWWLFFRAVLPGLGYAIRSRLADVSSMLLLLLGFGLLYSVMFGNVGLVFRQRAQLLPWLLIFASVGLERRALRRLARRAPVTPRRACIEARR